MKILPACIVAALWFATLAARAGTMIATATGTVAPGAVDQSNTQAAVFGPPGSLAGKQFTLTYTIDDTKGTQNYLPDTNGTGLIQQSSVNGAGNASAGTAKLTIGAVTVSFGDGSISPRSTSPTTRVARYVQGPLATQIDLLVQDNNTGGAPDHLSRTNVQLSIYRVPTNDGDWRVTVPAATPTSSNESGYFYYGRFQSRASGSETYEIASGSLRIERLTIQGLGASPLSRRICFNEQDVTKSIATAVVGEPVRLTAGTSGTPCSPVGNASQSWEVCGKGLPCANTISAYTPTSSNPNPGVVIPFCVNSPCSTVAGVRPAGNLRPDIGPFYWTAPGQQTVSYAYQLPNGTRSTAAATFRVIGPTDPRVDPPTVNPIISRLHISSPYIDKLHVITDQIPPLFSFGVGADATVLPGFLVTPSATIPQMLSGNFLWVQLISSYVWVETYADGHYKNCTLGSGLDNSFPYGFAPYYADGITTIDVPSAQLLPAESQVSWDFGARMYLLWQSARSGSIPVPLGFLSWDFTGDALHGADGAWSVAANSTKALKPFQPLAFYPQWTSMVVNGPGSCSLH